MNREEILKLIQSKSWVSIIENFKDNEIYDSINSDEIAKKIIDDVFINELISGNSFSKDSAYLFYLGQFYVLHKGNNFNFSLNESNFKKLVHKLSEEYYNSDNLKEAFNYAKEFPENEFCKKVIVEFEKNQAQFIGHTQQHKVSIKQNDNISRRDFSTSLFKSKQEYVFYRAVREVFQTYMVFPNVAMNAVIDWNSIKSNLNKQENSYFFKGLIDCVVIDQENDYKPIKFIELDSIYHDNKKQIEKDKMKDKIIGCSGHKLFRIRTKNEALTEDEFKVLIREAIDKN